MEYNMTDRQLGILKNGIIKLYKHIIKHTYSGENYCYFITIGQIKTFLKFRKYTPPQIDKIIALMVTQKMLIKKESFMHEFTFELNEKWWTRWL